MEPGTGKYLLSGASGMLGTALRNALAARQMQCLQLARSATIPRSRELEGAGGKQTAGRSNAFQFVAVSISGEIPWNPTVSPSVAHPELLEGLTAAIHLSGANLAAHRWTPAYKQEIVTSRVESTRALATTLAGLKRPPATLLVASASGIYGNRGEELIDESSAPGSGFLADLCRQWEAAAQPAVDAGIRVVYLRFGVALGINSDSGALARLLPIFRFGLGGRLGSGQQWMSWMSLADVVSAVFFLLENSSLSGPFNFTAPNPVTNAQFTRALARRLHRPAIFPVPASILRIALGEIADEALLSGARVFPSKLSAAGFQFAHPTVDLALAAALAKR
jgi:uncharacterized protein (TIGR01777 family)